MAHDWEKLTQLVGDQAFVIERVRLPDTGIAIEGPFELPPLARLSGEDQVFMANPLVLVAAPLMLVGLIVGVVISLFQALTQIQEQTIVFVPKILAIFAAMLIALPFMADLLHSHMARVAAALASAGAVAGSGRQYSARSSRMPFSRSGDSAVSLPPQSNSA